MPVVFANFAETQLSVDVDALATVFPVVSTAGFPTLNAGEYFYLVLSTNDGQREIVRCTSVSGTSFVVQRGAEGTTARAWSTGTRIVLAVTAAALAEFLKTSGGVIAAAAPSLVWLDTGTAATARVKAIGDTVGRAEGHMRLDVGLPSGSTNRVARLQLFRETTAPDGAAVELYRTNPSLAVVHRFLNSGDVHLALVGGSIAVGHETPQATLDVGGSTAVLLSRGTTGERPAAPVAGMLRYNTTLQQYEAYNGSDWVSLGGAVLQVDPYITSEIAVVSDGAVLTPAQSTDRFVLAGGVLRGRNTVVEVNGTGAVTITLPTVAQGAIPGLSYAIRNAASGSLTIAAPTGSTINGGSSIQVPWVDGWVVVTARTISGSAVSWIATGDLQNGTVFPAAQITGPLVLGGTVRGGRRFVGATITASMTLSSTDDVGVLRHVNGSSITVTVPSSFRGTVELVFDTAGTIAFEGGSPASKSISAGTRAIVDVHEVGATVYRSVYAATPV